MEGIKMARTATKIVAANNSTQEAKNGADYVCDGIADDVEIQNAINAADDVNGLVHLAAGTYNLSARLNISASIILEGEGTAGTILRARGAIGGIRATAPVVLRDFTLMTNQAGTQYGIELDGASYSELHRVSLVGETQADHYWARAIYAKNIWYSNFDNIYIWGGTVNIHTRGMGFYFDRVVNCMVTNSHLFALEYCAYLVSTTGSCEGVSFLGNAFLTSKYGIQIEGTSCLWIVISHNVIDWMWDRCVYAKGDQGCIQGNWFGMKPGQAPAWLVELISGADSWQICDNMFLGEDSANDRAGLIIHSNGNVAANNLFRYLRYGIYVTGDNNIISGNKTENIQTRGLEITNTADKTLVISNNFEAGGVLNNGTNTRPSVITDHNFA
jgi:hypothetical protein